MEDDNHQGPGSGSAGLPASPLERYWSLERPCFGELARGVSFRRRRGRRRGPCGLSLAAAARDRYFLMAMCVPAHPGELIRDNTTAVGWSIAESAERLDVSPEALDDVLTGRSHVSPHLALALEHVGGRRRSSGCVSRPVPLGGRASAETGRLRSRVQPPRVRRGDSSPLEGSRQLQRARPRRDPFSA